jgi:hypothetical protein
MPINLHAPTRLPPLNGTGRRGREGARAIQTIPERWAVGGAAEHRPFRVTPGGEHHPQRNGGGDARGLRCDVMRPPGGQRTSCVSSTRL